LSGHAEEVFEIINELGLHARAAAKLVRVAERFSSTVTLSKDGQRADAKSIMGLLLLCGTKGSTITVQARGADAVEAVQAVGALIGDRFGEER
jgi:phosphocarrier protein HPr